MDGEHGDGDLLYNIVYGEQSAEQGGHDGMRVALLQHGYGGSGVDDRPYNFYYPPAGIRLINTKFRVGFTFELF
jgi:hypothetical protein